MIDGASMGNSFGPNGYAWIDQNCDGAGSNASDNDTLRFYTWLAF